MRNPEVRFFGPFRLCSGVEFSGLPTLFQRVVLMYNVVYRPLLLFSHRTVVGNPMLASAMTLGQAESNRACNRCEYFPHLT